MVCYKQPSECCLLLRQSLFSSVSVFMPSCVSLGGNSSGQALTDLRVHFSHSQGVQPQWGFSFQRLLCRRSLKSHGKWNLLKRSKQVESWKWFEFPTKTMCQIPVPWGTKQWILCLTKMPAQEHTHWFTPTRPRTHTQLLLIAGRSWERAKYATKFPAECVSYLSVRALRGASLCISCLISLSVFLGVRVCTLPGLEAGLEVTLIYVCWDNVQVDSAEV